MIIIKCARLDQVHMRNLGYALLSMIAINAPIVSAILLLDIIYKITSLTQVLSVFNENKIQLLSTLALFFVCLYIASFVVFNMYRDDYQAAKSADDSDAPDFNLYCDNLYDCVFSTMNVGVRAGGGIGEAMNQPMRGDPQNKFYNRGMFDLGFFVVVNIVLMNILFGIIIDSFADKRAIAQEHKNEVQGQCFICGITKSRFDIENINWRDHIYCEHNMHSYVAFILYVK